MNIWYLESGVTDLEFPINYLEVQQNSSQQFLKMIMRESNRVIISALNSTLDKVRILDDVVFPTFNTINELYDRGDWGEKVAMLTNLSEVIDLIKFNSQSGSY